MPDRKRMECDTPFGCRAGEVPVILRRAVRSTDRLAVMAARVPPLPEPAGDLDANERPVENAAIIGAIWNGAAWQWLHLAPRLKELLGGLLFDNGHKLDRWYPFELFDPRLAERWSASISDLDEADRGALGNLFADELQRPPVCRRCGSPEDDHPYRHPFDSGKGGADA